MHQAIERSVQVDEDEDAKGAERETDRLPKRSRGQEVFITIKVSFEGAQSVKESFRDVTSFYLSQIIELVQVGFTKEFEMECLKALKFFVQGLFGEDGWVIEALL